MPRRQATDAPALIFPLIDQSVVQPRRATLPELEAVWLQQPATPERGTRHLGVAEGVRHLLDALLEPVAVGDGRRLRRRPRTDLRTTRTRREVLVALGVGHALDGADHAHLSMQLQPGEQHRRAALGGELLALGRLVVGEEREATLVGATHQQVPRLRPAVGVDADPLDPCIGRVPDEQGTTDAVELDAHNLPVYESPLLGMKSPLPALPPT